MNVYHTPQYQARRRELDAFFCEACRDQPSGGVRELDGGYSIRTDHYKSVSSRFCLSRHRLLDSERETVYTWDNIDNDGEFASLISHANGRRYLIFREDLYGYSVLEVETGQALHYIPGRSWPLDGTEARETFIWTAAAYDPGTSLLAVWGCYWACPSSMVFLDFSEPLEEQNCDCWLEMHEIMDPDYDLFDDIRLVRWNVRGWTGFECTSATEDTGWMEELVPLEKIVAAVRRKKST